MTTNVFFSTAPPSGMFSAAWLARQVPQSVRGSHTSVSRTAQVCAPGGDPSQFRSGLC